VKASRSAWQRHRGRQARRREEEERLRQRITEENGPVAVYRENPPLVPPLGTVQQQIDSTQNTMTPRTASMEPAADPQKT
jgi:hypothetical protein